jgi:hypothetical protein
LGLELPQAALYENSRDSVNFYCNDRELCASFLATIYTCIKIHPAPRAVRSSLDQRLRRQDSQRVRPRHLRQVIKKIIQPAAQHAQQAVLVMHQLHPAHPTRAQAAKAVFVLTLGLLLALSLRLALAVALVLVLAQRVLATAQSVRLETVLQASKTKSVPLATHPHAHLVIVQLAQALVSLHLAQAGQVLVAVVHLAALTSQALVAVVSRPVAEQALARAVGPEAVQASAALAVVRVVHPAAAGQVWANTSTHPNLLIRQ